MTDDRRTAVMLREIKRGKIRFGMAQKIHQACFDFLRHLRIIDDDIRLVRKEILRCRLHTALLTPRHRMSRHIVDGRRQNLMQPLIYISLCASRIGEDCTRLQIRQHALHHRYNLQDRWAEIHNIRIPDHSRKVRRSLIHRATFHCRAHRPLGAAKPRDIDVIAKRSLETESERAADESDPDDGELRPAHARRPTAGAI